MNKKQQQQMAAFFEQLYEAQEALDFIKLQLLESRHYNPNLLFNLISAKTEKITISQMKTYLEDKIAVNDRELYEIFERFDWSRQGFISRDDFLLEIHPFSHEVQGNFYDHGTISAQIQGHFLSLIVEILKRLRIIQVARKQIKYIQPYDAFQFIEYLKIGHFGIGQLRKLFFDNDFNVTDGQLYFLLHALRRRCYRDVTMEVFCENLNPLQFGEYAAYQYYVDQQKQREFQDQNRREEESMRRSRLQSQRIEHEFQKSERKKQAQIDRQIQLENKASLQITKYEEQKSRKLRKALMEEDKIIRHQRIACQQSLRLEKMKNQQDRIENDILNSRRQHQQRINIALAQSAFQRQEQIQRSRRQLQIQRTIIHEEALQRSQILKRSQAAALRELDLSKKMINQSNIKPEPQPEKASKIQNQSRKIYNQSASKKSLQETPKPQIVQAQPLRKKYEYDLSADIEESNCKENKFQTSRTRHQTYRKIQKESRRIQEQSRLRYYENSLKSKYQRQQQLQKIKPRQFTYNPMSHSRTNDFEKDLEQTRYEIQQRRKRRYAQQNALTYR